MQKKHRCISGVNMQAETIKKKTNPETILPFVLVDGRNKDTQVQMQLQQTALCKGIWT